MKINFTHDEKVRTASYIIAAVAAVSSFFIFTSLPEVMKTLSSFTSILTPFIYAFVIAYLLVRPLNFFERLLKKYIIRGEKRHGTRRIVAIVLTYIAAFGFISVFLYIVIPQLVSSISSLLSFIPSDPAKFVIPPELEVYIQQVIDFFHLDIGTLQKIQQIFADFVVNIVSLLGNMVPQAVNIVTGVAGQFYNVFFGLMISFYLLGSKEKYIAQIKKSCTAILPKASCSRVLELGSLTNSIFGKYVNGQLIDALVVGTICVVGMTVLGMPYAILIGAIVCVTNVIPMVGPFIGAIPGVFILLVSDNPIHAVYFTIFIICLQQLDGNVLAPLIVGGSTGISGFWTMFAVLIGGSMWGIPGIIVSVPTFTVLYIVASRIINRLLRKKGLSTDTKVYNNSQTPVK